MGEHSTAEELVSAIKDRWPREPEDVRATQEDSVFVDVSSSVGTDNDLSGLDSVCAIAYEHGYVPQGIIESGCARFRPVDSDEVQADIM